eukprot:g39751.t1
MSGDDLLRFHCLGVCPHKSCFLSVLRGYRNGFLYGCEIRAPHALVMTFLFQKGSVNEKLRVIALATLSHARRLGGYVALYKFLACLFRHVRHKDDGFNAFLAGAIAAIPFWTEETPITRQPSTCKFFQKFHRRILYMLWCVGGWLCIYSTSTAACFKARWSSPWSTSMKPRTPGPRLSLCSKSSTGVSSDQETLILNRASTLNRSGRISYAATFTCAYDAGAKSPA